MHEREIEAGVVFEEEDDVFAPFFAEAEVAFVEGTSAGDIGRVQMQVVDVHVGASFRDNDFRSGRRADAAECGMAAPMRAKEHSMPSSWTCVKTGEREVAMAQVPYPDAPGPGQALVKTTLSTICGSDIHIVDELPVPAGVPMGHEAVGVVEAVGAGVTAFKAGDRVVTSCLLCCGTCARCMEGDPQVCQTFNSPGNLLFGAQGEFFLVNGAQTSMAKVPDALEDEQVLLGTDIMSTGFGAIERAEMKAGDTVAVFAQGPVGLCATAAARTLGAGLIIAVESIPERQAMAKRLGADIVVEPGEAVARSWS